MANKPAKWRDFEDEVHDAVKRAIKRGYRPYRTNLVKVFRNQEYLARTTGSKIKMAVSIEAYRKDAIEPFLIHLWECKDYGTRPVEVGDVRELGHKILEIGASKTVGAMVTTKGFQSGALELAQATGISLFLLKKELEPLLRFGRDAPSSLEEVISVENGFATSGITLAEARLEDAVRASLNFYLAKDASEPNRLRSARNEPRGLLRGSFATVLIYETGTCARVHGHRIACYCSSIALPFAVIILVAMSSKLVESGRFLGAFRSRWHGS